MLAVISARRATLRAWLGEGAARYFAVGVLAASLGAPASTGMIGATAHASPVAQGVAKADTDASHTSSMQATGGHGPATDISQISGSYGGHPTNGGNVLAASDPASPGVGGGQGWNLPVPGMSSAPSLGGRIDLLGDIGVYELPGGGGSNSGSGGSRNGGSGSSSNSDSSEPGSTLDSPALSSPQSGSPQSGSWRLSSNDAFPGADGLSGGQAGVPVAILGGRAGSGSTDIASGYGSDVPPRSTRLYEHVFGGGRGVHGQGGGSAYSGAASLSGGLSGGLDATGAGGVSKAFRLQGRVGGGSGFAGGVPEPSAWAIMVLGLALVGGSARHRRSEAQFRPTPPQALTL